MQEIVQNFLYRLLQTLLLYKNYAIRNNPLIIIREQFINTLKNFLTVGKKRKMAQYRVNSQIYKVQKMEQLIAESNEHLFLQGRNVNEIR